MTDNPVQATTPPSDPAALIDWLEEGLHPVQATTDAEGFAVCLDARGYAAEAELLRQQAAEIERLRAALATIRDRAPVDIQRIAEEALRHG